MTDQKRCKHGMIPEYCHHCLKVEYNHPYIFPLDVKDKVTGKEKQVWIRGVSKRYYYRRIKKD